MRACVWMVFVFPLRVQLKYSLHNNTNLVSCILRQV